MSHQSGWFCGTGCLRLRPDTAAINGWYLFNYLGQDKVVGFEAHFGVAPLEVEALPDLFHSLVECVLDLGKVNLRNDVE